MTNSIKIRSRTNLAELAVINNIINPIVYEEINGSYTFSFDVAYFDSQYLVYPNVIEVDGQYFSINRVTKERNSSVSVKVNCEHISYELIKSDDFTEEYDATASDMMSSILASTRFNIGTVMSTNITYYKPSSTSIRQRLMDIANLFGGELIFNNFTISLVEQRGVNNGLEFELGENLVGVTEEVDNSEGYPSTSYDIDVIDLAQISGYEHLSAVSIGDTIKVIDPLLNINVTHRVLSYERNPFQKINPRIQIGQLLRDFTDYIRDEKEDDETSDELENKTMLQSFKVGDIDCLKLDNIDTTSAVVDYLTDTSLQGIIATTDYELAKNATGIFATLKLANSRNHLTALITNEAEAGLTTSFKVMPAAELSTYVLPKENVSVSVIMVVTDVPFADLASGLLPIISEGENFVPPLIEAYGVRFLINLNADGFLNDFKVGDVDCLGEGDITATDQVVRFIKNGTSPVAPHTFALPDTNKLKGIYATLKDTYKGYHITFIHSSKDANDTWTVETKKMPFTNARIFETPKYEDDSVIMVITKEPYERITSANVDDAFLFAFGVRFNRGEVPPETDSWLDAFNINDISVLQVANLDATDVAWVKYGDGSNEYAFKPENPAIYDTVEVITTITLKVKEEYKDYNKYVNLYFPNGEHIKGYYNEEFDENGQVEISILLNEQNFGIAFYIEHVDGWESGCKDYWLDVNIGNEPPEPEPTETKFRNTGLHIYATHYNEDVDNYDTSTGYYHKDFDDRGDYFIGEGDEILTCTYYVELTGFSGGNVEVYGTYSNGDYTEETHRMFLNLPSGNIITSFTFNAYTEENADCRISGHLKLLGSTATDVQFFNGNMLGVYKSLVSVVG